MVYTATAFSPRYIETCSVVVGQQPPNHQQHLNTQQHQQQLVIGVARRPQFDTTDDAAHGPRRRSVRRDGDVDQRRQSDLDEDDDDFEDQKTEEVAEVKAIAAAQTDTMGINNWPAPRRLSVGQQHPNYADPMSWSPAGTTTAAVARRRTRDDLAEVGNVC